jgi:uncharacterized protein YigE (DUF2233 family)
VIGDADDVLDWIVVRVDLTRTVPIARAVPHERLEDFGDDEGVTVALNAGFFDEQHRATGLLVSEGVVLSPPGANTGSGVLVIRDGRASVLDASTPLAPNQLALAVQNGPRLVETGGRAGIERDRGDRYPRTAVCVRDHGTLLDFVLTWRHGDPEHGPSLLTLARLLAGPSPLGDGAGCEAALNLDGGPSTGIFVRNQPSASRASIGPVPWAIVVRTGATP